MRVCWLARVLVALGTVFLALDLGAPDQAFRLFLTPSGSLLSAGAWALALFCATAFAAFLMGFSDDGPGLRVAETVSVSSAALLALFVVLYAGVFLSLYPAVPFLNSPLVPIVFVASALATGAAVLTIIGFFRFSRDETIGGFASLLRLDAVLVAIEAIAIAAFIIVSLMATKLPLIRLLSCYRDILQCCFGWVSCWRGSWCRYRWMSNACARPTLHCSSWGLRARCSEASACGSPFSWPPSASVSST